MPVSFFAVYDKVPIKWLVAVATWSLLAMLLIYVWSWVYLPGPRRLIKNVINGLTFFVVLYGGGIGLGIPSSVRLATTISEDSPLRSEVAMTMDVLSKVSIPFVSILMILIWALAACFLTWLFFIVGRDERDRGPIDGA